MLHDLVLSLPDALSPAGLRWWKVPRFQRIAGSRGGERDKGKETRLEKHSKRILDKTRRNGNILKTKKAGSGKEFLGSFPVGWLSKVPGLRLWRLS